eukprot:4143957-Pyramimonas_sp.AAC.1
MGPFPYVCQAADAAARESELKARLKAEVELAQRSLEDREMEAELAMVTGSRRRREVTKRYQPPPN